ncbi:MAG TPA: TolC family protein, partial [bacterium]|nr:TolC family protein [bacterium]
ASARADARMGGQMALAAYAWMPPQVSVELMGMDPARPDLNQSMQQEWRLTQELPFPGRTWAQGRVASHQAEGRDADADMVEQQELKAARQAFFQLAAADILLQGLSQASDATHEMAHLSERRGSFGQLDRMGQFMDTMLAMEDSGVDALRPMALQQRRAAEAELKRLMGADPLQSLPPAEVDVDALLAKGVPALKDAIRQAEARSPQLRGAQANLAAAEAARGLALSGWLPDLMVEGSVTEDSLGNRQSGAMLGASLPFVWFWKQAGEAGAASAALDKARQDLEAARLSLRAQVIDAVGDVQAADGALRTTWTRTLPQAAKGLELARSGFRTTALGSSEILMAVQDYRMTEENLSQLVAQWGAARAMLAMLTAEPLPVGEKP